MGMGHLASLSLVIRRKSSTVEPKPSQGCELVVDVEECHVPIWEEVVSFHPNLTLEQ